MSGKNSQSISRSQSTRHEKESTENSDDQDRRKARSSRKPKRYKRLKRIGKGSFGAVELVQSKDGQLFVMKVVQNTTESVQGKKKTQEALAEARVLSKLNHPNIVEFKEAFLTGGGSKLCIIMAYCDSGDLSHRIKKARQRKMLFKEQTVLDWFIQMVLGVHYLHSNYILHRDLKPQNIFLTENNKVVKLGDFGVTRVLEHTMAMAQTQVGTPYYMSPELAKNKPYNHKTDVWALGCILHEICTLSVPFPAKSFAELVIKITCNEPLPIHRKYSSKIRKLIRAMLIKDPVKRADITQVMRSPYIQKCFKSFASRYAPTSTSPRNTEDNESNLSKSKSDHKYNNNKKKDNVPPNKVIPKSNKDAGKSGSVNSPEKQRHGTNRKNIRDTTTMLKNNYKQKNISSNLESKRDRLVREKQHQTETRMDEEESNRNSIIKKKRQKRRRHKKHPPNTDDVDDAGNTNRKKRDSRNNAQSLDKAKMPNISDLKVDTGETNAKGGDANTNMPDESYNEAKYNGNVNNHMQPMKNLEISDSNKDVINRINEERYNISSILHDKKILQLGKDLARSIGYDGDGTSTESSNNKLKNNQTRSPQRSAQFQDNVRVDTSSDECNDEIPTISSPKIRPLRKSYQQSTHNMKPILRYTEGKVTSPNRFEDSKFSNFEDSLQKSPNTPRRRPRSEGKTSDYSQHRRAKSRGRGGRVTGHHGLMSLGRRRSPRQSNLESKHNRQRKHDQAIAEAKMQSKSFSIHRGYEQSPALLSIASPRTRAAAAASQLRKSSPRPKSNLPRSPRSPNINEQYRNKLLKKNLESPRQLQGSSLSRNSNEDYHRSNDPRKERNMYKENIIASREKKTREERKKHESRLREQLELDALQREEDTQERWLRKEQNFQDEELFVNYKEGHSKRKSTERNYKKKKRDYNKQVGGGNKKKHHSKDGERPFQDSNRFGKKLLPVKRPVRKIEDERRAIHNSSSRPHTADTSELTDSQLRTSLRDSLKDSLENGRPVTTSSLIRPSAFLAGLNQIDLKRLRLEEKQNNRRILVRENNNVHTGNRKVSHARVRLKSLPQKY